MKRFTETNKWADPWFGGLDLKHKLLWIYLCDTVDHVGVWDPNKSHAEFSTGQKYDWNKVALTFDSKVRVLKNGKWWVPSFIKFQFGSRLSTNSNLHNSIAAQLKMHGLTEEYAAFLEATAVGKSHLTESQPLPLDFSVPATEKPKDKFAPPTLDEVLAYARERKSLVNAKTFWEYFQNGNPPWTDAKGRLVRSWKQKFVTWENNNEGKAQVIQPPSFPMPKLAN